VVNGWLGDLFWAVCITNTDWRRWRHEKLAKIQNDENSCGTQGELLRKVPMLKLEGLKRSVEMRALSLHGKNRVSRRLVTKSIATRFNRV
jgi:hypothetical protein